MITNAAPDQQSARQLMASLSQDLEDTFKIMQADVIRLTKEAGEKGWTIEELENKIDALLIDPNSDEVDSDKIVDEEMK